MNVSENICPVCTTQNESEAIICGHCGAALNDSLLDSQHKTRTTDMQALTPEMIHEWTSRAAKEVTVPDSGIAFYIDGYPTPACIDSNRDFVLGRRAGTTSEGLLDLAPFGGYSMGLSRRHVVIRRTGDRYEVLDLGSVNGSWLNEQRLVPHRPYPLPSGSHLRLGRMRILVLYRSLVDTREK